MSTVSTDHMLKFTVQTDGAQALLSGICTAGSSSERKYQLGVTSNLLSGSGAITPAEIGSHIVREYFRSDREFLKGILWSEELFRRKGTRG